MHRNMQIEMTEVDELLDSGTLTVVEQELQAVKVSYQEEEHHDQDIHQQQVQVHHGQHQQEQE